MNSEKWEELYVLAAKESDGKKMRERVAAGREAIRGRLLDLEQSSDHHAERHRLETALGVLNVLEADAQKWLARPWVKQQA